MDGSRANVPRMVQRSLCCALVVCVAASLGCKASDEDCDALGDKFIELHEAERDPNNPLDPKLLENAAQAGKRQVVEGCKAARPPKASVNRCRSVTRSAHAVTTSRVRWSHL